MLSYSAIANRGKVTLPSVDAWSTNMNIMRDPVKSITTKRKDKVGDNDDITKLIDNSDRSSESILRYARGVNQFVSVSYSNSDGSTQASLPYKINKDGEFKVPVHAPQNLLALSRLPRNVTFAVSNPGLPHNGKELSNSRNQTTNTNTVKRSIISANVKATKTYSLQKPFQEAFEDSKYSVQNILHKSAKANLNSSTDVTTQNVTVPNKEINENNMNVFVNANLNDSRKFVSDNNNLNSERFLQETNWKTINSNMNFKNDQSLQDAIDISNKKLQDVALIEYSTPVKSSSNNNRYIHENFELPRNLPEYETFTNNKGHKNQVSFIHDPIQLQRNLPEYNTRTNINSNEKINYIHKKIDLQRNLPEWSSFTNIKQASQKNVKPELVRELEKKTILQNMSTNINKKGENNISSTDYFLQDTLKYGEYNVPANIPSNSRIQEIDDNFESQKSKMSKNVMKQFSERYSK